MVELANIIWSQVRMLKYNAQERVWHFKTDGSDWVLVTVPSVLGSTADADCTAALRDAIVGALYHPDEGEGVDEVEATEWADSWITSAVAASEQPDSNDGVPSPEADSDEDEGTAQSLEEAEEGFVVFAIARDKGGAFRVMAQGSGAQLRVGDCSKAALREALLEAYGAGSHSWVDPWLQSAERAAPGTIAQMPEGARGDPEERGGVARQRALSSGWISISKLSTFIDTDRCVIGALANLENADADTPWVSSLVKQKPELRHDLKNILGGVKGLLFKFIKLPGIPSELASQPGQVLRWVLHEIQTAIHQSRVRKFVAKITGENHTIALTTEVGGFGGALDSSPIFKEALVFDSDVCSTLTRLEFWGVRGLDFVREVVPQQGKANNKKRKHPTTTSSAKGTPGVQ
jgi:hypothetical protein